MKPDIRPDMLAVINSLPAHQVQSRIVIAATANSVGARTSNEMIAVLTCWGELFRMGIVAWGYDADNPDPPFAHLTAHGKNTLATLSRDPSNPDGYMATLGTTVSVGSVAYSYIVEAVAAYNAGCIKATAVMAGASAESLALELRDAIQGKLTTLSKTIPPNLVDWRIKRVLDAVEYECQTRLATMKPKGLSERFTANWSAFTGNIRIARNDAGHPTSVDPVTLDAVHGSLLIFPELARLIHDLVTWVKSAAFS